MKKQAFFLASLGILTNSQAEAQGWDQLGGLLNQACKVGSGTGVGRVPVQTGALAEDLQWVCQLKSTHGFITNNIINGDWQGFMMEIAGNEIGKYLNYLGGQLDMSGLNEATAQLNEALKGDYNNFRKSMYGSVATAYFSRDTMNEGADPTTAGGFARLSIDSNPVAAVNERNARLADAIEASQGLDSAYKTKKVTEEAQKAIESNAATALANATGYIGTPLQKGTGDKLVEKAKTAISTRELAQIQVEAMVESTKSENAMNVSILTALGELTQQSVMTNTQLMKERDKLKQEIEQREAEYNAAIEQEAQETLDLGKETMGSIGRTYKMLDEITTPHANPSQLSEVMP